MMSKPLKASPSEIPPILSQDNRFFEDLASRFVNGPVRVLLKDEARGKPGVDTLINLFKKAAQVGFMMWRQPLEIQIREFDQLRELKFPADDGEAKTHPSQLGFPIMPDRNPVVDMVVQPGFIARQENGAEKVWGRAVVLWH